MFLIKIIMCYCVLEVSFANLLYDIDPRLRPKHSAVLRPPSVTDRVETLKVYTRIPLTSHGRDGYSYSSAPTTMRYESVANFHSIEELRENVAVTVIKPIPLTPPTLPPPPAKEFNTSGLYCKSEIFQHHYITSTSDNSELMTNHWNRARIGERAGLRDVCLQTNGMPLTRRCLYNRTSHTAEWEDIRNWTATKRCVHRTRENIISVKLNQLHDQILEGGRLRRGKQGRREVTKIVCDLLEEPDYKLLPADVHLTSQIMKTIAEEGKDIELSEEVISICNILMGGDQRALRLSADLNATNSLLDTFENYMDALSENFVSHQHCGNRQFRISTSNEGEIDEDEENVELIDFSHIGVGAQIAPNLSVFYVNPSCANISGIAIYDSMKQASNLLKNTYGNFLYRFIYMNESASEIMRERGLQVASFVPVYLWRYILSQFHERQPIIVLKIYSHDALFIERSLVQVRKPFSKILSISIPGFNAQLPDLLPFILRNENYEHLSTDSPTTHGTGCGYWNYDTWISNGVQTNTHNSPNQPVVLCGTNHLTQFSFLLGGNYRTSDPSNANLITPWNEKALDVITLVGCSLSLLGLMGIWMTALLFRTWRLLASTKILLNLCVALTLQMILFVFVNTDDVSEALVQHHIYSECIALGALMQYSILVLFSWMLIVAFLQFQRYVTVIGIERPQHYILKSAIVAWCCPLIPTLLVIFIDPHSYIPSEYQLRTNTGVCYPSGHSLIFGVVLPVTLIVVANLIIFIYVFYSISHSLSQSMHRHEKQIIIKQIRLSILLFFLLGLSWIFGIFAFIQAGVVFSYLFCLTATVQGFVLFVYFVLLDDIPRTAWLKLLCPSRQRKAEKKPTEMQSFATGSTGLENTERH